MRTVSAAPPIHRWEAGGWVEIAHPPHWLLQGCSELQLHILPRGQDFPWPSLAPQRNPLPGMAQVHDFPIQMGSDNKFLPLNLLKGSKLNNFMIIKK